MTTIFDRLLALDQLETNTRTLAVEDRDDVTISQVGETRFGRPIEMISVACAHFPRAPKGYTKQSCLESR
jgi:hypothetical protein